MKNGSSDENYQESGNEAPNVGNSAEEVFEIVEGCNENETELQTENVEFVEE